MSAERQSVTAERPKISNATLDGHLRELADEWDAVKRGEKPGCDNNIWWINQTAYLGERFGTALIDDLLAARGLVPRQEGESR